jgi:hypothetical protein
MNSCAQQPVEDWPRELFVVADNIRRKDFLLAADLASGPAALGLGSYCSAR